LGMSSKMTIEGDLTITRSNNKTTMLTGKKMMVVEAVTVPKVVIPIVCCLRSPMRLRTLRIR
jgi:hypothetical protein